MCRHLARIGSPVSLASVLLEPEHSLLEQSWAPRHQIHGVVNADGFGVGWYTGARAEPGVYRRTSPIWSDETFASIAGVIEAGSILAAVRSATPGFGTDEASTPPFADGPWLFSHNGAVDGYWDGANEALRTLVSPARARSIRSVVDSAVLFALTLDRLDAGDDPTAALAAVLAAVKGVSGGRLNLLLTDGARIAATTYGNSLFSSSAGEAVVVASEPFGDGDWTAVPDVSVVTADARGVTVEAL